MPGRSLLPPPGAGRSSHPARAGQPGSASARRCRPAAARSYGPPPGTAAPARCSPPLPLTQQRPPGCARNASAGRRGPQQRPTLPNLPQLLRAAPRPPPFGGPLCPTPAATAPGCRAVRLGRSAPGCSLKGTGRALGAGCGPPQYPPGVKRCSPPCRAVRPRICPPQRAAGLLAPSDAGALAALALPSRPSGPGSGCHLGSCCAAASAWPGSGSAAGPRCRPAVKDQATPPRAALDSGPPSWQRGDRGRHPMAAPPAHDPPGDAKSPLPSEGRGLYPGRHPGGQLCAAPRAQVGENSNNG